MIERYELEPPAPAMMEASAGEVTLHRSMRILFLSLVVPQPLNNGHKMRTWSILRGLAEGGHEIHFVGFAEPGEIGLDWSELSRLCRTIQMVPLAHRSLTSSSDYGSRILGLFSSQPYATRRFQSAEMRRTLQQLVYEKNLDAILCDTAHVACNLPRTSLPLILNHHNVEYLILERYVPFEPNPAKRLYASIESRKLKTWERELCQRAAIGMACSEHDRHQLERLAPGSRVFVVPNVVDANAHAPANGCAEDPNTVVYQGGMDWFPNRDAVEFFVAKILPIVRRRLPEIRFLMAGRNPSEDFQRKFEGARGVEFTGTVPDMRPIIARAAVCVVPLRIGSGTRLKILEAAAMGKAIVSTSLGVEGLDFEPGAEMMIADDPEHFAHALTDLLTNPERRRTMGQKARRRIEHQYSPSNLRAALAVALDSLAQQCTTAEKGDTLSHSGFSDQRSYAPGTSAPIAADSRGLHQ